MKRILYSFVIISFFIPLSVFAFVDNNYVKPCSNINCVYVKHYNNFGVLGYCSKNNVDNKMSEVYTREEKHKSDRGKKEFKNDIYAKIIYFLNLNIISTLLGATLFAFIANIIFFKYSDKSNRISRYIWLKKTVNLYFKFELEENLKKIRNLKKDFSEAHDGKIIFSKQLIFMDDHILNLVFSSDNIDHINPEITSTLFSFREKIKRINQLYYSYFDRIIEGGHIFPQFILFFSELLTEVEKDIVMFLSFEDKELLFDRIYDGFATRREKWSFYFMIWFWEKIMRRPLG